MAGQRLCDWRSPEVAPFPRRSSPILLMTGERKYASVPGAGNQINGKRAFPMPMDRRFYELIELIESAVGEEDVDAQGLFRLISDSYGLVHIAYLGLRLPGASQNEPLVCVTYPESWIAHYKARNYVEHDPVIHQSLTSVFPTDWASFPLRAKKIRNLFGEAKEFGIGAQGMTFPIRGRAGDVALFSITSGFPDKDWRDFKRENLQSVQMFAFYMHQMILRSINAEHSVVKLSLREVECLKWAADVRC